MVTTNNNNMHLESKNYTSIDPFLYYYYNFTTEDRHYAFVYAHLRSLFIVW